MSNNQEAAKHMQAIREWVRQENKPGLTRHSPADLMLLTDHKLREHLAELEHKQIVTEQPFVSHTPFIGRFIVWMRTAWNWMSTKWYVIPLLYQQNVFNIKVVETWVELLHYLNHLVFFTRNIHLKLQHLDSRLNELETVEAVSPELPSVFPKVNGADVVEKMAPTWGDLFKTGPVVFLSAGRGESLAILAAHGIGSQAEQGVEIYGLEADPLLVQQGLEKNLPLSHTTDIDHLVSLSDETVAGLLAVWSAPMTAQAVVRLLDQSRRVLRTGSWVVWVWPWAAATDETNAQMAREVALGLGFHHVRLETWQQPELAFQMLSLQK